MMKTYKIKNCTVLYIVSGIMNEDFTGNKKSYISLQNFQMTYKVLNVKISTEKWYACENQSSKEWNNYEIATKIF